MAVEHVEINEIAEDQAAAALTKRGGEFFHTVGVAFGGDVVFHAAGVVDVVNLSDAENWYGALCKDVQQHRLRRIDGVIVAPRRSHKVSRRSREWPGNHATHAMRPVEEFPGDFAHMIQFRNRNDVFVCGDLENTVTGGVHDGLAGAHVLFAEFLYDFGAGCWLVADGATADLPLKLGDQLVRKSV